MVLIMHLVLTKLSLIFRLHFYFNMLLFAISTILLLKRTPTFYIMVVLQSVVP
uniref:Uncharacterized protein n=1 Tax=Arcella intermedia TaxID=1963864 RepID=A0A6B2LM40_9EUKA